MKVLITGATGFLGRRVLDLLCADPKATSIVALSRNVRSHPNPKVQVVSCDLAKPMVPQEIFESSFDIVIHLAAQYNFGTNYQTNFLNNVVATQNLLHWLRARKESAPRIIYSSTYAIGAGARDALQSETNLRELPPRNQPYARTKYLSEQLILESEFPATALRLGVLVGDQKHGNIEKVDGPYAFLRMLYKIRNSRVLKHAPYIPIVARKDAVLPLVPVDCAAEIVYVAAMRSDQPSKQIFGVYNPTSVSAGSFAAAAMHFLQIDAPIKFLPEPPKFVLKMQHRFTEMAPEMFDYACNPPSLSNGQFQKSFPDFAIPDFGTYQDAFFSGFMNFMGDENGSA